MANCDKEFERNLSEDLSPKEKESGQSSCEEKDVVLEDENNKAISSKDCNFDEEVMKSKDHSQNIDENTYFTSSNNVNECSETEQEGCSSTGVVEGAKLHNSNMDTNRQPSPISGGRRVDEVLLEEDELAEDCSGEEEEHYESAEEDLAPEVAEERMKEAMELKKEGNAHFKNQEYVEGRDLYTKAIKLCPSQFKENKSIFHANRAACFQKLEDYESAISDCNEALELSPDYLKVRLRRAQCYEKVEKLEEALEDYKIVFENDKSCQPAREAILRLPEEIKIKHEKLKEEMIGKLKDLGNMVLRPFGLSTDNFKLQQDSNSGGYSINFQK